jgi:hypothetical protein
MADEVTIPPPHQSQIAASQTPFNSSGGLQPRAVHSPRYKSAADELNVMAPNRSGFKVAFLGPAGTYSHQVCLLGDCGTLFPSRLPQCAHDKFGSDFEYVGCTEIAGSHVSILHPFLANTRLETYTTRQGWMFLSP